MKRYLVLYATREGHTRLIAEFAAGILNRKGWTVDMIDAARIPPGWSLAAYDRVLLAASIHREKHEAEMVRFAETYADELERVGAAFLSVSLCQAGVESPKSTSQQRASAAQDVENMIQDFISQTGWRPLRVLPVAGALKYTQYNFFIRWIMRNIARKAGGDTDTSRDYVYTDWTRLERFIVDLCGYRVKDPVLDQSNAAAPAAIATETSTDANARRNLASGVRSANSNPSHMPDKARTVNSAVDCQSRVM